MDIVYSDMIMYNLQSDIITVLADGEATQSVCSVCMVDSYVEAGHHNV